MDIWGQRVRPDIVFARSRVAVFVDGCFWHGCPDHGEMPVSNREFWEAKIGRTRERDQQQTAALEAAGWTVLRVWEHEAIDDAVQRVSAVLGGPRADIRPRIRMHRGHARRAAPRPYDEKEERTVP
jgi:DNA mismatch endonuclease (patch repair protein)